MDKFQEQISKVKKFNVKLNGKENAIELNNILIKKMTCDINANKNAFDKIKDKINQPQNFIKKNLLIHQLNFVLKMLKLNGLKTIKKSILMI